MGSGGAGEHGRVGVHPVATRRRSDVRGAPGVGQSGSRFEHPAQTRAGCAPDAGGDDMAIELKVPSVGESITTVEVGDWLKGEGDWVARDQTIVTVDSEKATVEVTAPAAGRLSKILKRKGETANVGDVIGEIDEKATAPKEGPPPAKAAPPKVDAPPPAASSSAPSSGQERPKPSPPPQVPAPAADHAEETVRMSPLRRTIAKRLVQAKQDAALLTTFNEV